MDFGTLNTVIAVARNRGVDVVRVHVSKKNSGGHLLIDNTDHK